MNIVRGQINKVNYIAGKIVNARAAGKRLDQHSKDLFVNGVVEGKLIQESVVSHYTSSSMACLMGYKIANTSKSSQDFLNLHRKLLFVSRII